MTSIVRLLIFANVAVYFLQEFTPDRLVRHFALWPWGKYAVEGGGFVGFEPWQILSYSFLHGEGLAHIAFNMYALYVFGGMTERVLGPRRFVWLYFASVLTAGVVQLFVVSAMSEQGIGPTVGASGGVFGVMLAFAVLFPHSRLMLLFPPIPLKAWVLVAGYAVIELTSGVMRSNSGVAHFAHLGGMLGAAIVMFAIGWRKKVQPPGTLHGP
jgi:membrane associated rhomboid family serine protease